MHFYMACYKMILMITTGKIKKSQDIPYFHYPRFNTSDRLGFDTMSKARRAIVRTITFIVVNCAFSNLFLRVINEFHVFVPVKDITNTEPLENTELTSVPDENMTDLEEIER